MVVNSYGPCSDTITISEYFVRKSFLKKENLELWGDLNFSDGIFEIWGPNA